ncbi:MAG: protease HtpX [Candidatus Gracilibacteria bacterium]|nr:protease HtpX [Candidatus Gracilibacteria bacterium]
MLKRIMMFLLMNAAIMVLLTITFTVLERVFGIQLTGNAYLFVFALIIGFGGSFISLALSKWMAKRSYNIQPIQIDQLSELGKKERLVWDVVNDLAERHHIKTPEVGIYEDAEANAFATGSSKNNSLVAVSTGLLDVMDEKAIEGVIAHEMAHILNGDMVTMALLQGVLNTFVVFISRSIANIISNFLDEELSWIAHLALVIVLEILFGLLASLVLMKFSRHREFKADAGAAEFVGKEKMIAGLRTLKDLQKFAAKDEGTFASMKISSKKKGGMRSLFASHPDIDARIKALEEMSI